LLVSVWNMNDETCKPVDGVEGSFGPAVLGLIYDLGRAVGRFFRRGIDHTLLGKTGPDDVFGQVAESGFVLRPNPAADVNMEAGMPPREHVFYNGVINFTLSFQHLQNFILEGLLKVFGMEARDADERAVRKKAAVGDDSVQVWIVIQKIAVRLYCNACSRDSFLAGDCGFQKGRKSPYVCIAMLAPGTASSRGTADFRKARVTFHAHLLSFPSRERSYIK